MKVGILGSGDVGRAMAKAFASEGHEVMIATRDASSKKAKELKATLSVKVGDFAQTAGWCELAVLCTLFTATKEALDACSESNLAGKIVIDVTNPLDMSAGMPPKLLMGHTDSGGEQVARWLDKSYVVKALNIVGNEHMYKPNVSGLVPTMLYCGNDADSKQVVHTILLSFGWQPVDIGDITGARELEPMCLLWVKYGMATQNWTHVLSFVDTVAKKQ